ncbi:MAG: hypothetical protein JST49_00605 [Bacteroidetes bacterium]|nr:hypothetical protein [Bacteroidota bacterium]
MGNTFLNWVKSYDIKQDGLTHNFFVVSQKNGYYNGVLVYILENRNRTNPSVEPAFRLHTEYLFDSSEDAVYNKAIERLKELFGEDVKMVEDTTNRFISW